MTVSGILVTSAEDERPSKLMSHCATGTRPDALQHSPNALPTVPAALQNTLSSNDPLSDADIPILHELHALFSVHLTRLDNKIASLSSFSDREKTVTLQRLKDDRTVLQDRSQQVLGALSAIRRFPKEVLQEIFLKLNPDAGFEVLDPQQGAWAASRVCSGWRSASRYPHLWTTFRLITSERCACLGDDGPVALLETALRYSGSCKLNFHVEFQHNDCVSNISRVRNLLDVLMAHSERWARASLVLPSELGMHLVGVRGKMPELRCLTFVGCDLEYFWGALGGDELPVIRAFEVAPQLRQVSVENALLCLNYPLLTSFTSKFNADFPHPVCPLFVIGHCMDLVHMDAYVGFMHDGDLEIRIRISNTSLTRLTINDPALLAFLSLPALLSLDVGDMSGMSCLPFIPPFLDASQCSLTTLYFRNSTLSGTPLANILALVPSLTDLGIGFHIDSEAVALEVPRTDRVLVQLMKSLSEVVDAERHRLVPKLKSIEFVSAISRVEWRFVGPDLVDMLRSRKTTLRRAWFRCAASCVAGFPNLSDASVAAFREMKDEGLDIAICALDGEDLYSRTLSL
ncbi:hypothetical protein BDZ89DRAFT_1168642 [Hymenopellis radicata]|nr:hypothetical protein BDZ89DRAFT_1168642 [Hymenopellis radicata]